MSAQRERPILFSAPMVRAILDGTKTQTRRALKPDLFISGGGEAVRMASSGPATTGIREAHCPYWRTPGDRLWVREAWGYRCSSSTSAVGQYMHTIAYRADDARQSYGPMPLEGVGLPKWRERDEGMSPEAWDARMTAYWRQWRPSMFMPRWASRITLEITDVRIERLQDISRGDAIAEGCPFANLARGPDPRQWYAELWDEINGPNSWDANPWVWVIEFKPL